MSPTGDKATATRRPHDADASRRALLEAAREVFEAVGYDRATTREIGERAGVDPALIARYFDSKEGLFIAAIAAGSAEEEGIDFAPRALVAFLLERWDERGHSPISRALASPALTPGAREQVATVVSDRVLLGLVTELRERGAAAAELRAELLVALAVGVAVTRANGTLETLAATPREELLQTLGPLLDALESYPVATKRSSGVLLYRQRDDGETEFLLIHPGGPYWAKRDEGAWSIPKGGIEGEEDSREAALRELDEELGSGAPELDEGELIDLGSIRQRAGKVVDAWAAEGEFDPAGLDSNTFEMEWPPKSGRKVEFPEVDRADWFELEEARRKLLPAQGEFLDRLLEHLGRTVNR